MISALLRTFKRMASLFRGDSGGRLPQERMSPDVLPQEPGRSFVVSLDRWREVIGQLEHNRDLTFRVRFTNGRRFTVPEFVNGFDSYIVGRVNGVERKFFRNGVWTIEAVPRSLESFPRSFLEGVVSAWKSDRKFGFVRGDNGIDYYFNDALVKDFRLFASLSRNGHGQRVLFRVRSLGIPGKPPQIEIHEFLREAPCVEVRSPHYARGWVAKNKGQVEEAIGCFREVLRNPADVNYRNAIKDLAECINRLGRPEEAFDTLESYRLAFAPEEQISLDRMEVLYLQKAGHYQAECELLRRILRNPGIPENQRLHFENILQKIEGTLIEDGEGGPSAGTGSDDPLDLARKRDKLILQMRGALNDRMLNKIQVFFGELGLDAEVRPLVLQGLASAREFAHADGFEARRSAFEVNRRILDELHLKDSCSELDEVVIPILHAVQEEVRSLFRANRVPCLVLSHEHGATYAVDDAGQVCLRLSLRQTDKKSPTLKNVTATLGDDRDSSVLVCEELVGGAPACVFELAYPYAGTGSEEVAVRIDYQVDDDEGVRQEHWEQNLAVVADAVGLVPMENPYADYAEGNSRPDGDYFVGRTSLVDGMLASVENDKGGVAFLIRGQRRTGKSTLRDALFARLDARRFHCTNVSMRGLGEDANPAECFLGAVLQSLSQDWGMSLADAVDLVHLMDEVCSRDDVATRLKYLAQRIAESGKTWVVAVDEFTDLYRLAEDKPKILALTGIFRQLLDQKVMHLLLIGMDSLLEFQDVFRNDAVVMNDCPVSYLEEEDVRDLLEIPMMKLVGEDCFSRADRIFSDLYEWSGGIPQLAQLLCAGMVDLLKEESRRLFFDGDLAKAARNLLEGNSLRGSNGRKYFDTFLDLCGSKVDSERSWKMYARIAASDGGVCLFDEFQSLDEGDQNVLTFLLDHGLVVRTEAGVRLRARLFSEWMRLRPNLVGSGGRTMEEADR